MIIPTKEYRTTRIAAPKKLHKGLDRIAYSASGRFHRRSVIAKSLRKEAERIIDASEKLHHDSDGKLRDRLEQLKTYFRRQGKGHEKHLHEAFAIMTEVSQRILGLRPYPVQILGALALYRGYLAEMATGEGKSLTACFPAIIAGWKGYPCHVLTANDYLAGRDAEEMKAFYSFCGVSVGWVSSSMDPMERRLNYEKDVVYTTSREVLADFLRDRLKMGIIQQPSRRIIRRMLKTGEMAHEGLVMRGLDTAIVDEADSVLIDEAVTPLIISHQQQNDQLLDACRTAGMIAECLSPDIDYAVERKYREINLTESGREKIEKQAESLPGLWKGPGRREELIIQALTAREFYHPDQQYVVQEGKVVIVDEFTGRLMPDRTWKHGLHQAIEVREGLELSSPNETLARLSFQRFFRFFRKLSGMTGTATEASGEFWDLYGLPVLVVPEHRTCKRNLLPDRVYADKEKKHNAIVHEIIRIHETGRPVLVGTRSVKDSETLAIMLAEQGLECSVLNAVRHSEEAAIVASAGRAGAITIATNMAGRGTDIKLGRGVVKLGGLHVMATERNESKRIDRQLFGRCARQGDPGSAQAFVSMDDELFRRFLPGPMARGFAAAVDRNTPGTERIAEQCLLYAQKAAQRLAFRQRRGVMAMDTWLDDALSFTGTDMET